MATTATPTLTAGPAVGPLGQECEFTLLLDTTDGSGLMTVDLTDYFSYVTNVEICGSLASTGYVVNIQKPAVTALAAQGTVTFAGIPVADETMVVGTTTITFKADGSGNVDHCTIGVSATTQVTLLVATLAECTGNSAWVATDGAGDTVLIEAAVAGAAGDAIVLTEAATNTAVDGGGTLGGTRAGHDANEALSATNVVLGFYEAGADGAELDLVAATDFSAVITGLTIKVTGKTVLDTTWA